MIKNTLRSIVALSCFTGIVLFAAEEKAPVKIESKIKGNENQKATTFAPLDNAFRFKVSPDEIKQVDLSDQKYLLEKINILKDKVLDVKSKAMLVRDPNLEKGRVVDVPIGYITIQHKDEMSSRFKMLSLTYIMDGEKVYSNYNLYKDKMENLIVYDSMVAPGHHDVIVQIVYTGNSDGVFDYLNDYRINVSSRLSFVVKDGKRLNLDVTGYETGKLFTAFKDRPGIKFNTSERNYLSVEKKK
jgi:hypothetical protein